MRIIRDFKMPNLKFKKIEMNDIPNMEDVKVDYEKVKEAEEKKKNNLPTYNEAREKEIKSKNMLFVNSKYVEEYKEFIESILKISKEYQEK